MLRSGPRTVRSVTRTLDLTHTSHARSSFRGRSLSRDRRCRRSPSGCLRRVRYLYFKAAIRPMLITT